MGVGYNLDVPWPLIRDAIPVDELPNETFGATISSGIAVFLNKLHKLLEDESTGFADKFLDKTEKARKILVQTHTDAKAIKVFTRFTDQGVIQIYLPRVRDGYSGAGLANFGADIEVALEGKEKNPADPISKRTFVDATPGAATASVLEPNDDFVDVRNKGGAAKPLFPTPFPTIDMIPRPDTLLRQAPYHLIMRGGAENISLEGHPPSVELVKDYLTTHVRTQGELEIFMPNAAFGVAVGQLSVAWARRYGGRPEISKTLVIALVENVLGFERVADAAGQDGVWVWRREAPFEGI